MWPSLGEQPPMRWLVCSVQAGVLLSSSQWHIGQGAGATSCLAALWSYRDLANNFMRAAIALWSVRPFEASSKVGHFGSTIRALVWVMGILHGTRANASKLSSFCPRGLMKMDRPETSWLAGSWLRDRRLGYNERSYLRVAASLNCEAKLTMQLVNLLN